MERYKIVSISPMQKNAQRHLKDALEKSAKSKLVFWGHSKNCVADALKKEMLSRNNSKEFDWELDSSLILKNTSQNPSIYNITYME